ncbi:hypothetical protein PR048_026936 [Dryococelus australis]|uniref:Uncharacterized protein n=1 Tax=Dryococelus australis TaxID=614101 RepID=A0ABQ9GMQ7_9NEOP|nr:hypothetical protein PR048_026936 [Dryococelus australis]
MSSHKLQNIVAIRVALIHSVGPSSVWSHVPSECNAAAAASWGSECWSLHHVQDPGDISKLRHSSAAELVVWQETHISEEHLILLHNSSSL